MSENVAKQPEAKQEGQLPSVQPNAAQELSNFAQDVMRAAATAGKDLVGCTGFDVGSVVGAGAAGAVRDRRIELLQGAAEGAVVGGLAGAMTAKDLVGCTGFDVGKVVGAGAAGALRDRQLELLQGAAEGAVVGGLGAGIVAGAMGAKARNLAESAARGAVAGAVGGVLAEGAKETLKAGKAGAVVGEAAASVTAGAAAGLLGEAAGKMLQKAATNKSEIQNVIKSAANEVLETPKDLWNHAKNKPLQTAVEFLVFPPILPVVSSKLDKHFGK